MTDFYNPEMLPVIDTGRVTLQTSSYDRKYENGDFDQFLYDMPDGRRVMFDEPGAGCIRSIWAAVCTDESLLDFFFDGEEEPRFTCTLKGLFCGEAPGISGAADTFEERGHYDAADCRCGNCFVPISFENGLKITARGKTDFYYHIMYEKYADGRAAAPNALGESAFRAFSGADFCPSGELTEKKLTLKPGYNTAFSDNSAGVFTELSVVCAEGTDISPIQVDITWDENRTSQVSAPMSHLFATPLGFTTVHSRCVDASLSDGLETRTLRLPMPYWKSAGICLVNLSEAPIDITLRLRKSENTYDEKHTGYFYAYSREGKTELFSDWLFAEFYGHGHVVGLVQTCHGGAYCEGNEHFYINGSLSPQINGTGTEDLYLGCYWPNLKYDSPVAGCVNDVFLMNDSTLRGAYKYPAGYYRFFLDMPISFLSGIRLAVQHGAVSQTYSDYSSTCMAYVRPENLLCETDFISADSGASRKMHGYTGGTSYKKQAKLLSDMTAPTLCLTGLNHTEAFSLNAAIRPSNNGVILRRLYDMKKSPQRAALTVDGIECGTWSNADCGNEYSFAYSDFYIPASVTDGKSELNIGISPEAEFTAFEFRVFSVKKM